MAQGPGRTELFCFFIYNFFVNTMERGPDWVVVQSWPHQNPLTPTLALQGWEFSHLNEQFCVLSLCEELRGQGDILGWEAAMPLSLQHTQWPALHLEILILGCISVSESYLEMQFGCQKG